ncbi:MAG: phage holin family protein [Sebaldella sp.]|nr:phage holin family protein [Sebaldella sp.]
MRRFCNFSLYKKLEKKQIMLYYVIRIEGISILENLTIMGVKMLSKIQDILEKLKDEGPE